MGFCYLTGKEVIPCRYNRVGRFSEGLAAVDAEGKWGFIDKGGQMVIPALFEVGYETPIFSEGLVAVQQAGKWGFADRTGNMVILMCPVKRSFRVFMIEFSPVPIF